MKIQRDEENNIIILDENEQELHPYVTVLAAIEHQQKMIPPRVPELMTQGWDIVVSALIECIENLGNPYKIVDTQVEIDKDGTVAEIISIKPVDETVLKAEETIVDTIPEKKDPVPSSPKTPPPTPAPAPVSSIKKPLVKR